MKQDRMPRPPPPCRIDYRSIWAASREERIALAKQGLPIGFKAALVTDLTLSARELASWIGISQRGHPRLNPGQNERLLGLARLVGQVENMVERSGNAAGFCAACWTGIWLRCPNPSLGGELPAEYVSTGDGRELLAQLLSRMESGAYS